MQHFDLKSANILLDKQNRAKLADVGLAKTLTNYHGSEQLSTFMATGDLGTFAWAAPEVGHRVLDNLLLCEGHGLVLLRIAGAWREPFSPV